MRQGDPEGRSSEGYASIKQAKTWLWHIEAIRGVVELVTNEELCKVVWGITVENFLQRERERERERTRTRTRTRKLYFPRIVV